MPTENTSTNPLELSDEDFLKSSPPPVAAPEPVQQEQQPIVDPVVVDEPTKDDEQVQDPPETDEGEGGDDDTKPGDEKDPPGSDKVEGEGDTPPQDKSGDNPPPLEDPKKAGKQPPASGSEEAKEPDYKAFYDKVMSPLKANGKTIDIKSPEELISLAQMGANYTRKMQALAPQRKLLMMLENNNLLDEGKLSFLIDIEKKNPAAIKQLIKDAGIDPRDIDLDDTNETPYLRGNHGVSDQEAGFRTTLDELSSNPEGKATLQVIQTQWDQASKDMLWTSPDAMTVIHEQRQNGIYDRVSAEVERLRILGQIPANVPFLQAYKVLGDKLASEGKLDDIIKPVAQPEPPVVEKTPVATRVDKPKPPVSNGDKVQAAASSRTSPKAAKTAINPLAMSDEEFMKQHMTQFEGRL